MKREISIERLVYEQMIGSLIDHQDTPPWPIFVREHLVPEIKEHVSKFYGGPEAPDSYEEYTYPGLDYTYPPHRRRLGMYPCHEKLFEVFDELGLTASEIHGLCTWTLTLHHRQRYERANKTRVRDRTLDWIPTETNRETRERLEREKMERRRQRKASVPPVGSGAARAEAADAGEPKAEAETTEGDVDDENAESSGTNTEREAVRHPRQQAPPRPRNPTAAARNSHISINLPSLLLPHTGRRITAPPATVAYPAPPHPGVSMATQTTGQSTRPNVARA